VFLAVDRSLTVQVLPGDLAACERMNQRG
jgi:hypothetical protein